MFLLCEIETTDSFFFFAFPRLVEFSAQHKLVYPLPVQFEHLNSFL